MIQRIQSLFLLGALASFVACFLFPFWIYTSFDPIYTYEISLFAIKWISGEMLNITIGTLPIIVLASVSTILCGISLFSFKNRLFQIKINNYNIFISLFFIFTLFYWIPSSIDKQMLTAVSKWQIGLLFPLVAVILLILANIFIKKDENLIKSTERLR
ncbi:MAG TPA: DUF4293 domain-containing protein [Bacteroidales bacterium]|nr:DUF4293 domain-containing protein [Bacteroidales bacterium]HQH19804.1 DUF4293 domain-containing protein [Bacteroidales bacterium]HQI46958.1 DUF4293 domain-containing protein [Bacteroidales bacterium]